MVAGYGCVLSFAASKAVPGLTIDGAVYGLNMGCSPIPNWT